MELASKLPIVVGVTGHRNVCPDDVPTLREHIEKALNDIRELAHDSGTPIVMLCGMAQGADMLCAEEAFKMNIPVYAVLPFDKDTFYNTFDDEIDRAKLYDYLDKCARIIYVPDIEQQKTWLQSKVEGMDDDSYWYRQVGIYMAKHSHLMIALWDGKGPANGSKFGCGTVEVVEFSLEQNYLNKDRLFKPGMISDSAVIWVKTSRVKQGKHISDNDSNEWLVSKSAVWLDPEIKAKQLWNKKKRAKKLADNAQPSKPKEQSDEDGKYYERFKSVGEAPYFLKQTISETVAYNKTELQTDNCDLWEDVSELSDYHQTICKHYVQANKLSYAAYKPKYTRFMLALALLGAFTALFFLLYDDASLPWMIVPCSISVGIIITLSLVSSRKSYHTNYIKYRAFAEALRIQFYLTLCLDEAEGLTNVCDLYSWSQKVKNMWIRKAIRAMDVISDDKPMQKNAELLDSVKEAWIGKGSKRPEGQLHYHERKLADNFAKKEFYRKAALGATLLTVILYSLILCLEIAAAICGAIGVPCFWNGTTPIGLSYRNIGAIIMGTVTAGSLLFSSYWGKLSFDRLYDDNDKMIQLYQSAYSRWNEVKQSGLHSQEEFESFVKEIAREEIVENGIWCSYIEENTLDVNL